MKIVGALIKKKGRNPLSQRFIAHTVCSRARLPAKPLGSSTSKDAERTQLLPGKMCGPS